MKPKNGMRPIHPGEILLEEFLKPLEMSARKLADAIGVPTNRVSSIVAGEREVTPDTALRLGRAFDTSPEFWLNLQQTHAFARRRGEGGPGRREAGGEEGGPIAMTTTKGGRPATGSIGWRRNVKTKTGERSGMPG
jgi:addiction module HigA family antidote